ncbi:MAG: A24 family peptidase [Desulfobacterales bacterium]|nr:A24 family peptidase [Desulfobacterales bacterium]MDD4072041.1 A24 family peptidase [Desulfobacterales bacterium]MDD4394011.1 A24 family peptidase [Desulfobacterales bacterium]
MQTILIHSIIFIFGICIGSFLNVCIFRLPKSKSIVFPGSACPECGSPIHFYDNIPILSYVWLKGRCRHCNCPISFRYPMVELISGCFALCLFLTFGLSLESLIYYLFITSLLVITFIDIDHQIIPDCITLPGIPIAFAASLALPSVHVTDSIIGFLAGGGILFLIAWLYYLITRKEGLGGGDIKLLAMIGTLLGWKGVAFSLFTASIIGTVSGLIIILKTKKNMKIAIPFGPFLSIGAILYIFFGPQLINWYMNLLR